MYEKPLMDVIRGHLPFASKADDIVFTSHGVLTLGTEIELQIIDPTTLDLSCRAGDILEAGRELKTLKPEIYQNTVEVNTSKSNDVHDIERDLLGTFETLDSIVQGLGLELASTGCHPFARHANAQLDDSPRFGKLIDRNRWLTRRMLICGMHVHLGMKSGDDYVRFNNFFLHFLPHLLALSASSPFWQGEDTGLMSSRPSMYEALPTAGQPYQTRSWKDFEALYQTLKKCGAIQSLKDLWWDMRPCPAFGTLEIRLCDGPATLAEATAIVAYIHLLAHWFNDNASWIEHVPPPHRWIARENKWRAMRYGLNAQLVINPQGDTKPIRKDIEEWLHKLAPYRESLGYGQYVHTIRQILSYGNSSERQRRILSTFGTLEEVVKFNLREFRHRTPLWERPSEAANQAELMDSVL